MHLTFRAFRAVNEPETCIKFIQEHRNVLRDYGISNVTSNTEEWIFNPGIYCVVAQSVPDNKILGGVRIQVSSADELLPVETAIGEMDPGIHNIVANFRNHGGVGELSALWNAKAVAGMGVSVLLVRAIVAAASQVPINTLMCICADYTLKMFQNVGFVIDNSLGIKGSFPYPNASYTARVLGIMNPHVLDGASAPDKIRINSLRENPVQSFTENGTIGAIHAVYNLVI